MTNSKTFSGKVVAKLPFNAFWPIKSATQRGIETEDLTDCAMTYIYVICSAGLRPNIQKLLGFTPPRQMTSQVSSTIPRLSWSGKGRRESDQPLPTG